MQACGISGSLLPWRWREQVLKCGVVHLMPLF